MTAYIEFRPESITPCKYSKGSTNSHTIPCQEIRYDTSRGECSPKGTHIIVISFSKEDLLDKDTSLVLKNRTVLSYGDSSQKYIEIPCSEIYRASVSTDMR